MKKTSVILENSASESLNSVNKIYFSEDEIINLVLKKSLPKEDEKVFIQNFQNLSSKYNITTFDRKYVCLNAFLEKLEQSAAKYAIFHFVYYKSKVELVLSISNIRGFNEKDQFFLIHSDKLETLSLFEFLKCKQDYLTNVGKQIRLATGVESTEMVIHRRDELLKVIKYNLSNNTVFETASVLEFVFFQFSEIKSDCNKNSEFYKKNQEKLSFFIKINDMSNSITDDLFEWLDMGHLYP
ncbi:hypothetical protein [Chryseobacterium phocaeense]|uniref:hypothetical protein n=1 Tax=Chryseobacterium phocaeense TaxID=1816690 RepID=UPI0009BA5FD3|nr:hypothetical protein [Chryseobacterium phocaeense]